MSSSTGDSGEGWNEIEEFVAEVSRLARSDAAFNEFSEQALAKTVTLLDAISGAVWLIGDDGGLRLVSRRTSGRADAEIDEATRAFHTRFLQSVIHSGRPQASGRDESGRYLWIAAPFQKDDQIVGLIEVLQPTSISSTGVSGNERLLTVVSELAGEHLRRNQLAELRESVQLWTQFDSLSKRAHASLDLDETAYQLVNDGKQFAGVDRVSLVVPRGRHFRTVAISGLDSFDPRSRLVVATEELSEAVAKSRQWLKFRGDTDSLPPQLETPVLHLADESHTQTIDAIPLLAPTGQEEVASDDVVAVLIAERFDADAPPELDERLTRLATLGSVAIRNALDYQTLPMLSFSRWLRRTKRMGQNGSRKLMLGGAAIAVAAALLSFIPAPLNIEAEGQAQPQIRRNVFAPMDGEVIGVLVDHDQPVDEEQSLIRLRSRELDLELQRLQGEYQTHQKKLVAIASARVQEDRRAPSDRRGRDGRYPSQLAAEEVELKQQSESLLRQLNLVREQREQLDVKSPIRGRVLTWSPDELLSNRPVQRGQLLVAVADLGGPWTVELQVDDRRISRLLDASASSSDPLEVSFTLTNDRTRVFHGRVHQIAGRTEVDPEGPAMARVTVLVDAPQHSAESGPRSSAEKIGDIAEAEPSSTSLALRPGSTVHAKIHCGDRSLGYVWFHDVFDTVRGWLLF